MPPRTTSMVSTESMGMPARRVPPMSASLKRTPSTITIWLLSAVVPKPRRSSW
ncbi:hypothetical protein LRS03_01625 [Rhizobacter sp. J219]|nr:hypothetical protein [Rhizobacter sp. J219]MCR5881631.1 hypothetical protein [Rhizobacter sp. J219]